MFIKILVLTSKVISFSQIRIDFNRPGLEVRNFWSSTGKGRFTVPVYSFSLGLSPVDPCNIDNVKTELTSSDLRRNIALIGSIPNNVIKQVEIN